MALSEQFQPFNAASGRFATEDGAFIIEAGPATDFFTNPDGSPPVANAPGLAVPVDGPVFTLAARLTVRLATTYDAGSLMVRTAAGPWAKFAFERSPLGRPTIVSVVTKDTSDDGNGEEVTGDSVWLRVHRNGPVLAFHWSLDGRFYKLARLFSLGADPAGLTIGLLAQSPMGPGATVRFDAIAIDRQPIADLRDGS